jgi:RND family efflux transporter MFP subunit
MEARQFFIEEWTEILGTTQPLPDRGARVSAQVEGHVISVLKDATGKPLVEGQRVKKGDVLVQLDSRIAQANRDKVEADQEELRQQVKQAELGVKLAQIEVRRLEELRKEGTPERPLVAQVQLEKAAVAVEEAKSKLAGAELRLKAGDKQLKALDEQLRLYTLTAPIAGRLGRILVVQGQTLAIGAPVAEILDLDEQIDLLCFVPPSIQRRLKEGQVVRIETVAEQPVGQAAKSEKKGPAESAGKKPAGTDGHLVYIADQAEVDTGNFAVKARFPNARLGLRGNVTLRARVLTAPGRACLTLPESALQEDQDPPAVVVVEDYKQEKNKEGKEVETGKARKLQVKVGMRDRVLHLVEILSLNDPEKKWQGSMDTAKFVVERGQGLRTGDPIRLEVEDEDEAAAPEEKKD